MKLRRFSEVGESGEVAADSVERQVDESPPPCGGIGTELLKDPGLLADQLPVVPAALDMPEGHLGVLVREGEAEVGGGDGPTDRLDLPWRSTRGHACILGQHAPQLGVALHAQGAMICARCTGARRVPGPE